MLRAEPKPQRADLHALSVPASAAMEAQDTTPMLIAAFTTMCSNLRFGLNRGRLLLHSDLRWTGLASFSEIRSPAELLKTNLARVPTHRQDVFVSFCLSTDNVPG